MNSSYGAIRSTPRVCYYAFHIVIKTCYIYKAQQMVQMHWVPSNIRSNVLYKYQNPRHILLTHIF